MRLDAFGRTAAALVLLALAGCGAIRGAPEPPMANFETYLLGLQVPYAPAEVIACLEKPLAGQEARNCRDKIVQALMIAIDLRFEQFELGFFDANRYASFGATLATLGLSTAGAVISGGTSQLLSAAAAGVTGAREAFKREVLVEQTSVALLTAMRAQRDKIGERIRLGLRLEATTYPLGAALADVSAYYRAGTIVGGLTGVSEAVGVERREAEQKLRDTVVGRGFSTTERAERLRAYIENPAVPEEERARRRRAFRAARDAEGLDAPMGALLRDTGPGAEERLERIEERINASGFSTREPAVSTGHIVSTGRTVSTGRIAVTGRAVSTGRAASTSRAASTGRSESTALAARLRNYLRDDPDVSDAAKARRRQEFRAARQAEGLGNFTDAELLVSGRKADERLARIARRMKNLK